MIVSNKKPAESVKRQLEIKEMFFKKNILINLLMIFLSSTATAQSSFCPSTHPVEQALKGIDYTDVPSAIDCTATKIQAEKLICGNKRLKLMELLDTRAYVYAYENATAEETNHNPPTVDTRWVRETRNACRTIDCLCKAFQEHTNSSLGASRSPYIKSKNFIY